MANTVYQYAKECNLLLKSTAPADIDMFSFKKIDEIYGIDYEYALQYANELRSLIM